MRASLVLGTVAFAVGRGVPMEAIEAATGLRSEDLVAPDGWLPEAIMPALWRLLAARSPGRAVALEMAEVAPLSVFGPLAYVSRSAPDMRVVLRALVRYRCVLSDRIEMALAEGRPHTTLSLYHPMDEEDGGHAAEMGLAMMARFGRQLTRSNGALVGVELRHQPFGPQAHYRRLFEAPVRFGCAGNRMIFDDAQLDTAMVEPDPSGFQFIQSHLELVRAQLRQQGESESMLELRAAIAHNAERAEYGDEALARRLGMSLRKVQRVTQAHGTTVRTLLEQAREANARQLLGDRRLSVQEVAFLLGYSEDRAFRRAFKRWTGQTPAEVRKAAQS